MLLPTMLTLALFQGGLPTSQQWEKAERQIPRRSPSAFKQLPSSIVKQLEARGCTIPQVGGVSGLHNVIRGEFAARGQTAWAVLCSKGGKSVIWVFWNKPSRCPRELAPMEDIHFLETGVSGQIEYSRGIRPVGKDYILKHYEAYGGPKPPTVEHQGIEDYFVGKASVIWYCYRGKWLQLTGAD